MTEAERFREQAEWAHRLSLGSTGDDLKHTLRTLAEEYEGRAAELEQRECQQRQQNLRPMLQPRAEQQQQQANNCKDPNASTE